MKRFLFFISIGLFLLLSSCYSNYVHLKVELEYHNPTSVYKSGDSTKIAFVSTQTAYLRATGISAFPDGGQVKYLLNKTGIYVFDTKSKKLTQLEKLTDHDDSPWYVIKRAELLFVDSFVYYHRKVAFLDVEEAKERTSLEKKYKKCYSININTKKKNLVDTIKFNSIYEKYHKKEKVDLTELKKFPLAEFGLIIQDIYPKSDEDYIEETIYLKSDGQTSRRAVIEQIISKLDKKEIKQLLKRMDDHSKTLEGYEKSKYDTYSKETYENIQSLL